MKRLLLLLTLLVVLAWCPWLSKEEALSIVDAKVAEMQASNPNLCPISIDRDSIKKVAFGYTEKVAFDCTVIDAVYGVTKSTNVVFITFYKGLFGMPNESVIKSP